MNDLLQGISTGLLMYPYTHPIQVGWCSRNAGAVASRTVSASVYNMYIASPFSTITTPLTASTSQVRPSVIDYLSEYLSEG